MRLKVLLSLLLVAAVSVTVPAQSNSTEQDVIRCATVEVDAMRRAKNTKLQSTDEFEAWMAGELKKRAEQSSNRISATRVLPTVVHVIYSNATENISTAQVISQIDVLNEDFGRLNPDTTNTPVAFRPVAADTDIEFCLAQLDPNGNPTNGINRVSMGGSPFSINDFETNIKPATQWDPNRYFNIWVANLSGGLLGYAQFPEAATLPGIGTGNGAANTDGVVCLYTSVGRPPDNPFGGVYNQGRTATHEVGHWLGLRHIWGDGGCAVDDFCADTPESDGSNFGCPTTHVSCGTTDMVQNYMDYTDDLCMNIFTQDQKARIDVVMAGSPRRASLLTSTECSGTPEISFVNATTTATEATVSGSGPCRGFQDLDIALRIGGPPAGDATVTMTVVSSTLTPVADYDVLIGSVIFPNGVTGPQTFRIRVYDDGAVEAAENMVIGFTISGTTDATAGTPNQHTLTLSDNDLPAELGGQTVIFTEDFESGGAGWSVQNQGGQNQWLIAGLNGGMGGARSSYISRNASNQSYNRNNASASRLRSPAINATGQTGLSLSFDFESNGEQASGVNYDFGSLSYSLDGTNFTNFLGDATSTPFVLVGTATAITVPLPAAVDNTTFYLGFDWENDNNSGSNPPFTIDDIQITAQSPIPVETTLNATNDEYLGPFSTVYWYDQVSGDVLLRIDNNTAFDYGCTSVAIDRAGTGATLYMDASMAYGVTDKTFLVTPTNNNPAGQYFIRLYFNNAEINGWETATGQARSNITIAKTGGPISNITPGTPLANGPTNYYSINNVRGTYATNDFFVEGEFTTGFSGFGGGIENTQPVPVEFVDVFAFWKGQDAEIEWETAEFRNLNRFEVQRKLDNRNFMAVGNVVPAASQMLGANFSFVDQTLSDQRFENVYYRIHALDLDGTSRYSEVRRLVPEGAIGMALSPNPFSQTLELRVQLADPAPISVSIYNPLGQLVFEEESIGETGTNLVNLSEAGLETSGIWFVHVRAGGESRVFRAVRE